VGVGVGEVDEVADGDVVGVSDGVEDCVAESVGEGVGSGLDDGSSVCEGEADAEDVSEAVAEGVASDGDPAPALAPAGPCVRASTVTKTAGPTAHQDFRMSHLHQTSGKLQGHNRAVKRQTQEKSVEISGRTELRSRTCAGNCLVRNLGQVGPRNIRSAGWGGCD
jgi:hypothetical protein